MNDRGDPACDSNRNVFYAPIALSASYEQKYLSGQHAATRMIFHKQRVSLWNVVKPGEEENGKYQRANIRLGWGVATRSGKRLKISIISSSNFSS